MRYQVEARYINNQPRLRVLDAATGTVFIEWNMQMLENMMEEGEFKREEFLQPERYGMKLLVKNLFWLAWSEKMINDTATSSTLPLRISPRQAAGAQAREQDWENRARPWDKALT